MVLIDDKTKFKNYLILGNLKRIAVWNILLKWFDLVRLYLFRLPWFDQRIRGKWEKVEERLEEIPIKGTNQIKEDSQSWNELPIILTWLNQIFQSIDRSTKEHSKDRSSKDRSSMLKVCHHLFPNNHINIKNLRMDIAARNLCFPLTATIRNSKKRRKRKLQQLREMGRNFLVYINLFQFQIFF